MNNIKIILIAILLTGITTGCFASGHTNLDGLEAAGMIIMFILATALLNLVSLVMAVVKSSYLVLALLRTCILLDAVCLVIGIWVMRNRYAEHQAYVTHGRNGDNAGYANFSAGAITAMVMILIAVLLNFALLRKVKRAGKLMNKEH